MSFRGIRWRIVIPLVALIIITMSAVTLYVLNVVRQAHVDSLEASLTSQANLVADAMVPLLSASSGEVQASVAHYGRLLNARVTVVAATGLVLGDTAENLAEMDNHLSRPEVQGALSTGRGAATRYSDTLGYEMMYVAVPVRTADGDTLGVVRVALPLRDVRAAVARVRGAIVTGSLVATLLAAGLAYVMADRIVVPIRRLTEAVERLAAGDLRARLLPTTRDEVGTLTRSFNVMADRLRAMISSLESERGRLAAILDYMVDGVLIADAEGRVRLMNPAAMRILGVTQEAVQGRRLAEVVRLHEVIALWQRCSETGEEHTELIEAGRQGPYLQAIVTPLREDEPGACLVILQDLTRVRQLETVRRDFVSNISHELRTPLASLKALSETLRDGALDDPPAARHFIERMDAEVDALTQMVQELLELSRIESGQVPVRLVPVALCEVVLPPVERLRPQAERSGVELRAHIEEGTPVVLADPERIQQVVTNLVHNAIKFTPAGGSVRVYAVSQGDQVAVYVQDTGVGISAEDLPRIFERFYKADRARTGGGTGLGLAIARHIVQAHGGEIGVESVEGRGSTFHFTLLLAESASSDSG